MDKEARDTWGALIQSPTQSKLFGANQERSILTDP